MPGGRGAQSGLAPPCLREAELDHQRLPPAPPGGAAAGQGLGPHLSLREPQLVLLPPLPLGGETLREAETRRDTEADCQGDVRVGRQELSGEEAQRAQVRTSPSA